MKSVISIFLAFVFSANLQAAPIPGNYNPLLIAVNNESHTISGYYENYTGLNENTGEPQFSCIFYLKGTLSRGNRYSIKTWFPDDRDPDDTINGFLTLSNANKTVAIHLNEEHGGCWNVESFSGDDAPKFNLVKQSNWIDIRIVSSAKAYFYKKPDNNHKRKTYVIKGDVLRITKRNGGWLYAEYENKTGMVTKGWVRETDLYPNTPPS